YYFDKCLPFGCSVSCKTWEIFATFLEFLVRKNAGRMYCITWTIFLVAGKRVLAIASILCKHSGNACSS
ncbi:MAG: hypothetical protein KZQ70_14550, partial [gamma proteobacterium symbiont of Lucinoma myriamae]|nr:hypothetical protein [gamma proteobacterium symbiont of Lucinoma myriamae]